MKKKRRLSNTQGGNTHTLKLPVKGGPQTSPGQKKNQKDSQEVQGKNLKIREKKRTGIIQSEAKLGDGVRGGKRKK